MTSDVLVMGGGATGQLAAAYLRMRFPDLRIAVVEGPHKNRPIVGESLVEVSVDFLLELGLGAYLVEKHYPKYGLTYYFKLNIDDPADRTYVVDEIPTLVTEDGERYVGTEAAFEYLASLEPWEHDRAHRDRWREHADERRTDSTGRILDRDAPL